MNNQYKQILFLIIISLLFYTVDVHILHSSHYKICMNNWVFHIIQFIHHLIVTFAILGILFTDTTLLSIYIVFPFLVYFTQYLMDGRCFLTLIINKLCKTKENEYFKDITYMLGLKKMETLNKLQYIYVCFVWVFSAYKLYTSYQFS